MKRFHVHAHVEDIDASVAFYSRLFGAEPSRVEADNAKWMIDDQRINFAISTRGGKPGVDHLGIQAESEAELAELKARARAADMALMNEGEVSCCYARSDKYWLTDPQGIAWEQLHTLADIPLFGEPATTPTPSEPDAPVAQPAAGCCPGNSPRAKAVGGAVAASQQAACC